MNGALKRDLIRGCFVQVDSLCVDAKADGHNATLVIESEGLVYEGELGLSDLEQLIRELENVAEQIRNHQSMSFDVG